MLYLGLVLGVISGTYAAQFRNLNSVHVYFAMILLIAPALFGARLLFAATHWELFSENPRRIFRRSEGGAMLYGGLLLSLAVSVPLLQILNLSFAGFWDVATITILVAMIPARIGCLMHGCCSGRATAGRFSIVAPNESGIWERRVPTQIMEMALAVALLLVSLAVQSKLRNEGVLFLTAATGYGIGRWWLESVRETTVRVGDLNLQRIISCTLAGSSAIGLLFTLLKNF